MDRLEDQTPESVGEFSARYTGVSKSFLTKQTLNIIKESRRARLEGRTGQYRKLKREAVRAVRRDKELRPWKVRDSEEPLVVN